MSEATFRMAHLCHGEPGVGQAGDVTANFEAFHKATGSAGGHRTQ